MDLSSELKPCPFCGSEVFLEEIEPHKHLNGILPDHPGSWYIECSCGVGIIGEDKQDVINRWNHRHVSGETSDGYHTFDELYYHRMILFSVICKTLDKLAWKSWKHSDGTMYDDYFIVGITTPKGDYSYHYHKDYWNMFAVEELPNAPEWDGHLPKDIDRLSSLSLFSGPDDSLS